MEGVFGGYVGKACLRHIRGLSWGGVGACHLRPCTRTGWQTLPGKPQFPGKAIDPFLASQTVLQGPVERRWWSLPVGQQ